MVSLRHHSGARSAGGAGAARRGAGAVLALLTALALLAGCGGGPTLTRETASYRVTLMLDAARFGDRTATVEVADKNGQPVEAAVTIAPTMKAMGMASPPATARPIGPGRYQAPGAIAFTMTGDWELDVRISANGREELASFTVTVDA
jgi:hypothetical protein